IRALYEKYNMTYIGIDATGVGYGVYELVKEFARRAATAIIYNPESKTGMVLKVHDLVEHGQIEWSEKELDILSTNQQNLAIR
ncbi:hypothetical protein AO053_02220, partial [Haemophilus influenzae biotype aegyptius]